MARTATFGAAAMMTMPRVAAQSPSKTGASGPRRVRRSCAASSPRKKPKKPKLETRPMVEVDMEKAVRKSGTNSPNPMRAGPYPMAVAAKPAAERLRK